MEQSLLPGQATPTLETRRRVRHTCLPFSIARYIGALAISAFGLYLALPSSIPSLDASMFSFDSDDTATSALPEFITQDDSYVVTYMRQGEILKAFIDDADDLPDAYLKADARFDPVQVFSVVNVTYDLPAGLRDFHHHR